MSVSSDLSQLGYGTDIDRAGGEGNQQKKGGGLFLGSTMKLQPRERDRLQTRGWQEACNKVRKKKQEENEGERVKSASRSGVGRQWTVGKHLSDQ